MLVSTPDAPDAQAETPPSIAALSHPTAQPVHSRRYRIDLIGASALLVAGAGLAGTLILFRAPLTASPTTATVGSPSLSVAPVRDQWYLERSNSPAMLAGGQAATAGGMGSASVPIQPAMKDRWYEDTPTAAATRASGPPVRDQWYLPAPAPSDVPGASEQPRDRWYLDGR